MFHGNLTKGCCGRELGIDPDGTDHAREKNAQKNLAASTSDAPDPHQQSHLQILQTATPNHRSHPCPFPSFWRRLLPHTPRKNITEKDDKYMGHAALERLVLTRRYAAAALQNYEDQIYSGAELQSSSRIDVSLQPVPRAGKPCRRTDWSQ